MNARAVVGFGAIIAPAAHSFTDVMESYGGGFSTLQLGINYAAFVAMPFIVLGLYAVQRPRIGWAGLAGAVSYGAAFVYFAGTATYALARATPDYATLLDELGPVYHAHGLLMIIGGVLFGAATARVGVLPRWTGYVLIAGVMLNLLIGSLPVPPIGQIIGSAIRNVALIGMGVALLRSQFRLRAAA
jgi:hypothetical protein